MSFLSKASALQQTKLYLNEPLAEFTSFKVGGPAEYLAVVQTPGDLQQLILLAQEYKVPWMVLGKGSNLLVLDEGIAGLSIVLEGEFLTSNKIDESHLYFGAGLALSDVSKITADESLSGLEFAIGIPGSFGGGIYMNAGAYDGELSNVIESVEWMDLDGHIYTLDRENCQFGYRKSYFQKKVGVILGATLKLEPGARELIQRKMDDLTEKRESKQPLEWPSAGSTFKRPPGYFAGTLIREAGLSGFRVGGAQVSEKHAGFVINYQNASARDVLHLIQEIRVRVHQYAGVWLIPEVRIIGKGQEEWEFFYQSVN